MPNISVLLLENNKTKLTILAPSEAVEVFSLIMWTLTISFGIVGNVLLSLTIACSPSLRTAMNTYVLSIGLVDLLTCMLMLPLRVVVNRKHYSDEEVTKILYGSELFVRTFTDITRLLLMQSLSFERYQAIAKPFSVTKDQARKRAMAIIGGIWLVTIISSILSVRYSCDTVLYQPCYNHHANEMQGWGDLETYVEFPLTLLSVLAIGLSYVMIVMVLREQRRKMNRHSKPKTNQVAPVVKEEKVSVTCDNNVTTKITLKEDGGGKCDKTGHTQPETCQAKTGDNPRDINDQNVEEKPSDKGNTASDIDRVKSIENMSVIDTNNADINNENVNASSNQNSDMRGVTPDANISGVLSKDKIINQQGMDTTADNINFDHGCFTHVKTYDKSLGGVKMNPRVATPVETDDNDAAAGNTSLVNDLQPRHQQQRDDDNSAQAPALNALNTKVEPLTKDVFLTAAVATNLEESDNTDGAYSKLDDDSKARGLSPDHLDTKTMEISSNQESAAKLQNTDVVHISIDSEILETQKTGRRLNKVSSKTVKSMTPDAVGNKVSSSIAKTKVPDTVAKKVTSKITKTTTLDIVANKPADTLNSLSSVVTQIMKTKAKINPLPASAECGSLKQVTCGKMGHSESSNNGNLSTSDPNESALSQRPPLARLKPQKSGMHVDSNCDRTNHTPVYNLPEAISVDSANSNANSAYTRNSFYQVEGDNTTDRSTVPDSEFEKFAQNSSRSLGRHESLDQQGSSNGNFDGHDVSYLEDRHFTDRKICISLNVHNEIISSKENAQETFQNSNSFDIRKSHPEPSTDYASRTNCGGNLSSAAASNSINLSSTSPGLTDNPRSLHVQLTNVSNEIYSNVTETAFSKVNEINGNAEETANYNVNEIDGNAAEIATIHKVNEMVGNAAETAVSQVSETGGNAAETAVSQVSETGGNAAETAVFQVSETGGNAAETAADVTDVSKVNEIECNATETAVDINDFSKVNETNDTDAETSADVTKVSKGNATNDNTLEKNVSTVNEINGNAAATASKTNSGSEKMNITVVENEGTAKSSSEEMANGKKVEIVEMDGTVHVQVIQNAPDTVVIEGAVCLMNPRNREQGRRRVELKAALKVGLLLCCYVVLWMPLPVSVLVMRGTASWGNSTKVDLLSIFSALATSTAAADPLLYGLLNRQMRSALAVGVRKIRRKITSYFKH